MVTSEGGTPARTPEKNESVSQTCYRSERFVGQGDRTCKGHEEGM